MKNSELITMCALLVAVVVLSCVNGLSPVKNAAVVFETSGNEDESRTVSDTSDYFETARYQRRVARDEAIGALKGVLNHAKADEMAKSEAAQKISEYASRTEKEFLTESRMAAKGFDESVVLIGEDTVTVVVRTNGLTRAQSAQIMDVIASETKYSFDQIKIIEIK